MLHDEVIDESKPLEIFHPTYTWKTKVFTNYKVKELLKPLYIKGRCKYNKKAVLEIKNHVQYELSTIWEQYKRLSKPHIYKVDLSRNLWYLKTQMIDSKKVL
nr:putative nicotinate phosphribosyltransferase [Clostridioides difficile]